MASRFNAALNSGMKILAKTFFVINVFILYPSVIIAQHTTYHQKDEFIETGSGSFQSFNYNDSDSLLKPTGILLNDDPEFNPKCKWYIPVITVTATNIAIWAFDRFALNADYSRVGLGTSKRNLRAGWVWDDDKFGINFVGHPYSGSLAFNNARACGYNFYQSVPYAVIGSAMWEYFGENTTPSYNDIINTPVSGILLGEILYRLSSEVLDDRTRGRERVLREIAAGLINPTRGFNRLIQGKTKRITTKEIYQKEPVDVAIYGGLHKRNSEPYEVYGSGPSNATFNIQIDYGSAFEEGKRKPYDYFKFTGDLSFQTGRKILDIVTGYGLLAGTNRHWGKTDVLIGLFQHFDYWDNYSFEFGSLGFGGGIITHRVFNDKFSMNANLNVAIVPLAGTNGQRPVDSLTLVRDYNYGGGGEGKLELSFNVNDIAILSFNNYYYYIQNYVGSKGKNFLGILIPRLTLKIYRSLRIGYEHDIHYLDTHFNVDVIPDSRTAKTEQKILLQLYFPDSRRIIKTE